MILPVTAGLANVNSQVDNLAESVQLAQFAVRDFAGQRNISKGGALLLPRTQNPHESSARAALSTGPPVFEGKAS